MATSAEVSMIEGLVPMQFRDLHKTKASMHEAFLDR